MKYIFIFLQCILLGVSAVAQPTITCVHNLSIGDKYDVKQIETETDLTVAEGPNITWDFSAVTGTFSDGPTTVCVDPATTIFADSAVVTLCNVALKPFGTDNGAYQFLTVDDNTCELLAIAFYESGNSTFSTYYNPATVLNFPFTYNSSFSDISVMWGFNFQQYVYSLKDTVTSQTDGVGYGTVKTPAGTFQNALLVKSVNQQHLWLIVGDQSMVTESIVYNWYVPGIKLPVLVITKLSDVPGVIMQYVSQTTFADGGIDNGGDGGDGGDGDGDLEPYDPAGVWLNVESAGGGLYEKNNGSLSWTLGEPITETHENSAEILTQGFRQPAELLTSVIAPEDNFEVRIYPNPFNTKFNLQIEGFSEKLNAEIYSATGQIIRNFIIDSPVFQLNMAGNKPGIYYLRVSGKQLNTFKIIKQ